MSPNFPICSLKVKDESFSDVSRKRIWSQQIDLYCNIMKNTEYYDGDHLVWMNSLGEKACLNPFPSFSVSFLTGAIFLLPLLSRMYICPLNVLCPQRREGKSNDCIRIKLAEAEHWAYRHLTERHLAKLTFHRKNIRKYSNKQ